MTRTDQLKKDEIIKKAPINYHKIVYAIEAYL